jgi:hypothetical protein
VARPLVGEIAIATRDFRQRTLRNEAAERSRAGDAMAFLRQQMPVMVCGTMSIGRSLAGAKKGHSQYPGSYN